MLPNNDISEREMSSVKKQRKVMGKYGHLGYPRYAEEQLGKLINQHAREYLAMVAIYFVRREDYQQYMFL